MFKKKKTWIIIIIVLLVVLIIFAVQKGNTGSGLPVSVEAAKFGDIIETVSANGKIQPAQDVIISPYISGEVVELYVKEGDEVMEGDLLAKIDPEIYISAYERAEANLNSQQANLANAKARQAQSEASYKNSRVSYERNKSLWEQDVISQAEYDASQAAYEVAKAEVDASKQTVASAKYSINSANATLREANDNLTKTTVSAPRSGTVSKLNVEKGERVTGASQFSS
ncbi:MAG: efflux RND transporter periplasmic adaptor subunit, partial [Bacteroidetes bacterium]